ncbi:MAG: glycosyltransferase [Lentilitoribacter sp.]
MTKFHVFHQKSADNEEFTNTLDGPISNGEFGLKTLKNIQLDHEKTYVIFLRQDDQLSSRALTQIVSVAELNGMPGLIYTDHDRLTASNQHHDAHYKPDWNETLFLATDYVDNAFAVRCDLLCDIVSQVTVDGNDLPFEVFLRAMRKVTQDHPVHIPEVLFHLQSEHPHAPIDTQDRRINLLNSTFEEEGLAFTHSPLSNSKTNIIDIRAKIDVEPKVTIIIPTRDRADLMAQVLSGVYEKTDYQNFDVLVVDNESRKAKTHALFQHYQTKPNFKVIPCSGVFNFSKMMNIAAAEAKGSVLCLLNNDIEMQKANWLKEMVGWAVRDGVGAVGAKLLYPDRRIQHAGVVMGVGGVAGHAFKFFGENDLGYHGRTQSVQEFSAVTAACLVVEKSIYHDVGGFNADDLAIAFNDVDFCLKLRQKNYFNIYTPLACLTHHESVSRGKPFFPKARAQAKAERDYLANTWSELIANDPCYSPHLSRSKTNFSASKKSK